MRFNKPVHKKQVYNLAGGKAFNPGDRFTDLYIRTATQLVKTQKFYGDKDEQYNEWIARIRALAEHDPTFVLSLASYVRNHLKLRTAPVVMFVETLLNDKTDYKGEKYSTYSSYAYDIIQRADEIQEMVAYYISLHGDIGNHNKKGMLPNLMKKVINFLLTSDKFNEYQLVKNDKNNASVSLRDVLRICHPVPESDETSKFFKRVIDKDSFPEVEMDTWEGIVSKEGSNKASWEKAIQVMPIFALLRNIRNFYDNDVSQALLDEYVIKKLKDPKIIEKSKILPFRYYQAYKEVRGRNLSVDQALEAAVSHSSLYNIPEFPGKTAVFVDVSGSMHGTISEKSQTERMEIGALFGAILFKKLGKDRVIIKGYDDRIHNYNFGANDSIFHIVDTILQDSGGATYGYLCPEYLWRNNIHVDRLIMFSDMQSYSSGWGGQNVSAYLEAYRRSINSGCIYYDVDLAGYGTVQVNPHDRKNIILGGWSEKIFDFMNVLEEKRDITDILKTYVPPSQSHHRHHHDGN